MIGQAYKQELTPIKLSCALCRICDLNFQQRLRRQEEIERETGARVERLGGQLAVDHPHRHQDPARRLGRRGDRLGNGRVHPEREPQRTHHDAALAETLALREGQVPGEQEGPLEDEEDAGTVEPACKVSVLSNEN